MSDVEEEDPFDAFGSDDSDDSDSDDAVVVVNNQAASKAATTTTVSQLLVQASNQKIQENKLVEAANKKSSDTTTASSQHTNSSTVETTDASIDLSYLKPLHIASWPPPLYQCPKITLVEELPVGGGRGYVASQYIPSGTLVLVEEYMMEWAQERGMLDFASVQHVLQHDDAKILVPQMEEFHPTKVHVDAAMNNDEHQYHDEATNEQIVKMMKLLRRSAWRAPSSNDGDDDNFYEDLNYFETTTTATHDDDNHHKDSEEPETIITELVQLAQQRNICSSNGTLLNSNDILRLLLALRYNGLESGVYRHVAMLNHDDDHANCAKLRASSNVNFSEVRTTRPIFAGETLTISYLPRVMSHASRRHYLWRQHRFDIGTTHLKGKRYKMELVGPSRSLPPSPLDGGGDDSLTRRIEKATEELENMLQNEIVAEAESLLGNFETTKALELSSLELYNQSAQELCNEEHILMIPILSLHVEACALVLKDPALANAVRFGVLARQTCSILRLLPLQEALLGPDHFDLARTNLDLANAVSELLSRSAKHLYELKVLPNMGTFASWSSLESKARREHHRIKQLYPHDAAQILAAAKS